jgi:hypothetical protein
MKTLISSLDARCTSLAEDLARARRQTAWALAFFVAAAALFFIAMTILLIITRCPGGAS